jgi:hypothetical protein
LRFDYTGDGWASALFHLQMEFRFYGQASNELKLTERKFKKSESQRSTYRIRFKIDFSVWIATRRDALGAVRDFY